MVFHVSPSLLVFYQHKGKTRRDEQKGDLFPWAETRARTAEVKYTLKNAALTLRLESPKESQSRNMTAQDGRGAPHSSIPRAKPIIHCFL